MTGRTAQQPLGTPLRSRRAGVEEWRLILETPLPRGAAVVAEWISVAGEPAVIRRLEITAPYGVTMKTLRATTLRLLRRSALDCWKEAVANDPRLEGAAAGLVDGILSGPRRPGPRGRSDQDLVIVACLYMRAIAEDSRNPWGRMRILAVASGLPAWIRESLPSRLKADVRKCRRRGILTVTTPRRAGGELTAYGQRLQTLLDPEIKETLSAGRTAWGS